MESGEVDRRSFKRALTRAVAAPVLLALLLAGVLLAQVLYLLSVQRWVGQSDEVIEQAYRVEKLLVDLETGIRGFVITHDGQFLEPHDRAAPSIEPAIQRLIDLTRDNSPQRARADSIKSDFADWNRFGNEVLSAANSAGDTAGLIRGGTGMRLMERIRANAAGMIAAETKLRSRRVADSNFAARVVILSTIALCALLGLVLALATRRRLLIVRTSYADSLETIRKQTESMRASEERYRRLFEWSPDGIFVQCEGKILYANRAMAAIMGASSPQDLVGYDIDRIIHPDYRDRVRERLRVLREQQRDVPLMEQQIIRIDHSSLWVEIAGTPFDCDGRPGSQAIVRDISQRKSVQQALQASEASLTRAQEIAHLGSWEWDLRTNHIRWSQEMYRIFGMPAGSQPLSFEAFSKLLDHDDRQRVTPIIQKTMEGGGAFNVDYRIAGLDGVERQVNAQGEAGMESGKVVRLFGTVQDITARKQIEEALRELNETLEQRVTERTAELREANEDLRAFAWSISHDLRAPLRSMQGLAQALIEDYSQRLDETGCDYIRRIVAASARMDHLTAELLEYNQLLRREIVPQRISLVLVLHDVVGQISRDPQLRQADINIHEPMPWLLAHRTTLSAVVLNLISNAVKFVAPEIRPVVDIRAENRGSFARIWFDDNGIGIPPEHQERIFGVFERLHGQEQYGGIGIGLAIVRRGVERMGGRAGVESTVGSGSRFWIELPKDPQSP